ncbi:MAG: DNA-3-methyladenine glycosylase [Polyangiaceae bacterium]|nr:DNA-3-methyladenine glycosylase [Polyangiaceae bacterium]
MPRGFCQRSVLTVARELIGKYLVREQDDELLVGRIVESEAYRGPDDRAAHSFGGRRTQRTEVMFGPAGLCYVFRVYGIHDQVNVVAGDEGQPHAVLIRALEPCFGLEALRARRLTRGGTPLPDRHLMSGPGKLAQAMGITLEFYGHALDQPPLYLAERPGAAKPKIARSPRVGIDYAGRWAQKPWRFSERDSPWVSVKPSP